MWKLQPPWKKSPPLSQQPPFKSWGPVKPPLFENLVGGSTPPPPAERGYTVWPPLTPPHPTHCTHTKTMLLGSGFHALKFKTLNSEYLNINHFLNKCQNNVVEIYFINKLPQRRIGAQASEHYGSMINFASNIKQV